MLDRVKSHFYAYVSKIRWLQRWGLKRNVINENVMEHSWEVATITHALGLIRNTHFGGSIDVNAAVVAALYHDCGEVITGDMPSPIKYHSPEITQAYKAVEKQAEAELLALLPKELQEDFKKVLIHEHIPDEQLQLIKAADTLCAYIKCKSEVLAGNFEFYQAEKDVKERLDKIELPEVEYFLETFVPSYGLTLDELLK
ncbi:MAG: 5'-deoxynucleotidase [Pseudohongiellaceae bacterium]|nr:5'-deoxynucleotidase [Pseudohongiellaceae bacterium]